MIECNRSEKNSKKFVVLAAAETTPIIYKGIIFLQWYGRPTLHGLPTMNKPPTTTIKKLLSLL